MVMFELLGLAALIGLNAFFSMAEFALISSRRSRLMYLADQGSGGAKTALALLEEPEIFLSTIQIAITVIGIGAGAYGGATLSKYLTPYLERFGVIAPYAEYISVISIVLIITYLTILFGELVPKRIGMQDPENLASRVAGLLKAFSVIFAPLVGLMSLSTSSFLRLIRADRLPARDVTEEEIRLLIEEGVKTGIVQPVERRMVESVFRLGDRRVYSLMVPRPEIVALDVEGTSDENMSKILENPYSRFPLYRNHLDNIVGIVRVRDIWTAWVGKGELPSLSEIALEPCIIPENFPVFRLLEMFRKTGSPMAVAVDEFGAVAGIVTLQDILEAIVGDLSVTYASREKPLIRREDGSILVDGLFPIDETRDVLGVRNIPGEEKGYFHTLSGFVMMKLGRIPLTGDAFEWGGYRFEVVDMDGRRIDKVMITPMPSERSEE